MNKLTLEEKKRANKIRCKLLYTIDKDIRETIKKTKNHLLINSMTSKELEDKFLLFPNYKMKLSTTFTKIADKCIIMKTVDNRLNQKFYYSDYLQDIKQVNHPIVKSERKRISANNIIKINFLVDNQEAQSPLPEAFTNKMNIGEKKLIQPDNQNFDNSKPCSLNEINNNKDGNINSIKHIITRNKTKKLKFNNDDDSINSLTHELIQKKGNLLSESLNTSNKTELKRRKNQLEAIRQLRLFCFQKLRNKRRCITKSSHQNLLYINNKFQEEEEEKNNTSYSSKKNNKNNTKKKINKTKTIRNKTGKNNSKKKYDILNESKRKRNNTKNNKEKKKTEIYNNSLGRKLFRHNSSKKSPPKLKRIPNERKSLVINNFISGKLESDILKFKKRKKEKNEGAGIKSPNIFGDDDILAKITLKLRKKRTGILQESLKDKNTNRMQLFFNKPKDKKKSNYVVFNEPFCTTTKRNSSENNFFNRKHKTKNQIYSSTNLIRPNKIFKFKRKSSECKSDRERRYSTPNKSQKKKKDISQKSVCKLSYKKNINLDLTKNSTKNDKKEKINYQLKDRKTFNYIGKIKMNKEMQRVEEEDY